MKIDINVLITIMEAARDDQKALAPYDTDYSKGLRDGHVGALDAVVRSLLSIKDFYDVV